jgi:hypothetical protein
MGLRAWAHKATENAAASSAGGAKPRSFQAIQVVAKLLRFPEIDLAAVVGNPL